MDYSRRSFLRTAGTATLGAVAESAAASENTAARAEEDTNGAVRWGMVIDLRKCIGCQACTVSCTMENQLPENQFRTIVSAYEVDTAEGPQQALLPRLCNHCEDPPCIPVCPADATYQQADGVVVVDADQCVGCGYCVQACPYDARFLNHETGVADKCTFCVQRVSAGLLPACVETCVGGARVFGNLKSQDSAVRKLIDSNETKGLRPEMGTRPQVYYIGLDGRLQDRVAADESTWSVPLPHGA